MCLSEFHTEYRAVQLVRFMLRKRPMESSHLMSSSLSIGARSRSVFPPSKLSQEELTFVETAARAELDLVNVSLSSVSGRYAGEWGEPFRECARFFLRARAFARFLAEYDSELLLEDPECISGEMEAGRPHFIIDALGQVFVRSFQLPGDECLAIWIKEYAAPLGIIVVFRTRDTAPRDTPRRWRRIFATAFTYDAYPLRSDLAETIAAAVFDPPHSPCFKLLRAYATRRAKWLLSNLANDAAPDERKTCFESGRQGNDRRFVAHTLRQKIICSVHRALRNVMLAELIDRREFQTETQRACFNHHHRWLFRSYAGDTRRRRGKLSGGGSATYRELFALLSPFMPSFWRRLVAPDGMDPAYAYMIRNPHQIAWLYLRTSGRWPGWYRALRRRLKPSGMLLAQRILQNLVASRMNLGVFADKVFHDEAGSPIYLQDRLPDLGSNGHSKKLRGLFRITMLPPRHVYSINFNLALQMSSHEWLNHVVAQWPDDERSIRVAAKEFRKITGSRERHRISDAILVYLADTLKIRLVDGTFTNFGTVGNLAAAVVEARRIHEADAIARNGARLAQGHAEMPTIAFPPIKGLQKLETFRLKTVGEIAEAGANCGHCISSYIGSAVGAESRASWLLRSGTVCSQIEGMTDGEGGVFRLKVRQTFDARNRVSRSSRRFAAQVAKCLESARKQPDFEAGIVDVIASQKRRIMELAKMHPCPERPVENSENDDEVAFEGAD